MRDEHVVTSLLCHPLHPMSHCMLHCTCPMVSKKKKRCREVKKLVGWRVPSSRSTQKSELRKGAKQNSSVSVRSVVHHVAGQTQHQSGSASVSAAAAGVGSEYVWTGQEWRRRKQHVDLRRGRRRLCQFLLDHRGWHLGGEGDAR